MIERPAEKIARVLKTLVEIPSLPEAVRGVLELSEQSSDTRQLAAWIRKDHGLATKVQRIVNSAFYSLTTPISSLTHASSLLGAKTIKSLALTISLMDITKYCCAGFDSRLFWRHSLAVAIGARRLGAWRGGTVIRKSPGDKRLSTGTSAPDGRERIHQCRIRQSAGAGP